MGGNHPECLQKTDLVCIGSRNIHILSQCCKEQTQLPPLGEIHPSMMPRHWCVKFGSLIYNLKADKKTQHGVITVVQVTAKQAKQYKWSNEGKLHKKESDVLDLIQAINNLKLPYKLFRRNCQHTASAIGNYALGEWSYEKALKYFTG